MLTTLGAAVASSPLLRSLVDRWVNGAPMPDEIRPHVRELLAERGESEKALDEMRARLGER